MVSGAMLERAEPGASWEAPTAPSAIWAASTARGASWALPTAPSLSWAVPIDSSGTFFAVSATIENGALRKASRGEISLVGLEVVEPTETPRARLAVERGEQWRAGVVYACTDDIVTGRDLDLCAFAEADREVSIGTVTTCFSAQTRFADCESEMWSQTRKYISMFWVVSLAIGSPLLSSTRPW